MAVILQIWHCQSPQCTEFGGEPLNIGDKYVEKDMVGLPWMLALELKKRGWILRNDVIWNKMKGTQSAKDRLRNTHEYLFHFVRSKSYLYDYKSILKRPKKLPSLNGNGKIMTSTGVSGTKYRRMIRESDDLNDCEKTKAMRALNFTINEVKSGKVTDFRMTIRGCQRIYHSDKESISGRSKELAKNGFYIIKMSSGGFIPNTVWNIVPEDKWRKDSHSAVFPPELLDVPIKSTCPEDGIVLDPFMGTGSAIVAAVELGRRGVGIELSGKYVKTAHSRLGLLDHF